MAASYHSVTASVSFHVTDKIDDSKEKLVMNEMTLCLVSPVSLK